MKDKNTINLILISSRWFNSFLLEIVHDEVILGSSDHLFFPEFQVFRFIIVTKLHLNHRKASPCVLKFSFFYHPFIIGVLHGGSTWWFIKDSFHSSFVLQDFSQSYDPPSHTSSILHLAFQSAILSTLSFEVVLCHSWQFPSCFMIHMLSRMRYFKSIIFSSFKRSFQPINPFVGIILGYISPKAFPKDCCYLWCS